MIISGQSPANSPAPIALHSAVPSSDPGWNRVTTYDTGTATYLGFGWCISISHVGSAGASLTFGTTTYVPDQIVTIPSSIPDAGLRLMHITIQPGELLDGMPPITLATAEPGVGVLGRFIGTGKIQTTTTYATRVIGGTSYTGYQFGGGRGKRWGDAPVYESRFVDYGGDFGPEGGIYLDHVTTAFLPEEGFAMGVLNDSGSPYFLYHGSSWVLAGIVWGSNAFYIRNSVPYDRFAPFLLNSTFMTDLSVYRADILDVILPANIPEPTSLFLLVGGALLMHRCVGWRRRD